MAKTKILIHSRPWMKPVFDRIFDPQSPEFELSHMADFLCVKGEGLQQSFEENLKAFKKSGRPAPRESVYRRSQEIIHRCRLLRRLSFSRSLDYIVAMDQALLAIFDRVQPEVLVSLTVDNYVTDLIALICQERNIPYLGFVQTFMPDYFRLTVKGGFQRLREPEEHEVETVLQQLTATRRPSHIVERFSSPRQVLFRYLGKVVRSMGRALHYRLLLLTSGDRRNYHYLVSARAGPQFSLEMLKICKSPHLKDIPRKGKDRIYLPLQYYPEATIDYWVPNPRIIDYEQTLFQSLKILEDLGAQVLVKEHPTVLGLRRRGFYERISSFSCVQWVSPAENSVSIIESCDMSLIFTGTVGLEAAVRGKPVLHFGKPYYAQGPRFVYVEEPADLEKKLPVARSLAHTPVTELQQKELVRHLLRGCLPGRFIYGQRQGFFGRWNYDFSGFDDVSLSALRYVKSLKTPTHTDTSASGAQETVLKEEKEYRSLPPMGDFTLREELNEGL